MPQSLEEGPHDIFADRQAGPDRNTQAMAQFVQALRLGTMATRDFATTTKLASGKSWTGQGFGATWSAVNYVGSQIGSRSGSSFIERRVDWALFGAGTSGASVLGRSLMVGLNNNDVSYSTRTGLHVGQTFQDAVKYNAGKALYEKTGADPFGVASVSAAEQTTGDLTANIARYGGKVTPQFRSWYFDIKQREANAEIKERQEVNKLAASKYGGTYVSSQMPTGSKGNDEKLFDALMLIKGTMDEIKNDVKNWLSGGKTGSDQ